MNWKSEVLGEVLSEVFAQHLTLFHSLSTKDFPKKKWGDEVIKRLRCSQKRLRYTDSRLFSFDKSLQIFLQSLLLLKLPVLLHFFTYTMEHFFYAYEIFVPQAGNKNCIE